jgi:4-hydroxythreonine-4-phosphate dehydrogenase
VKPVFAITLGEPAGIGPEIVAAILEDALICSRPIIFGHWPTFERALASKSGTIPISIHDGPVAPLLNHVTMVHCGPLGAPIDEPCRQGAEAQFIALKRAADAVLAGICDAIVTAPVSKSQVTTVCPGFTGHTEYLAARSGLSHDEVTMIFASKNLAVGLVSTHIPLVRAAAAVTRPRLERTVVHLADFLSRLHPGRRHRIAVSAVNPHAGEQGLLGMEETAILQPFCRDLAARSDLEIIGPIPADTVFRQAFAGDYDGVVAAYHDQAMIPLKFLGPGRVVNVTWGLPFTRTSPDHGVAYDLAGKKIASPIGMKLAIELAAELTRTNRTDS